MHRQFPLARRRRLRLAGAIAGVTGLAMSLALTGAAYPAAAGTAATSSPAKPTDVFGPAANVRTVILPTGDQITLTTNGKHEVATAQPAPGHSPEVEVNAFTRPDGTTSDITALPADVSALVNSGLVDRGLFDVTWLAAHGDTGTAGKIAVSIGYGGGISATVAHRNAAALPGATIVGAAGDTVRLSVAARDAAAFWAALTGRTGADAGKPAWTLRPRLTGGAVKVSATAHSAAPTSAAGDGQPLYTVTTDLKMSAGCDPTECSVLAPLMIRANPSVYGYEPDSVQCATSASPCTEVAATYRVPAGVYEDIMNTVSITDNRMHLYKGVDPQVTVAGDTTVTFDTDKSDPVTTSTPHGNYCYECEPTTTRIASDGTGFTSVDSGGGPYSTLNVAPASVPVTMGTYHFSVTSLVGKPPLSVTVNAPQPHQLFVRYPGGSADGPRNPNSQLTGFSGTQTLEVVDAGHGDAADFAGVDVKGKLVLLRPQPSFTELSEQEFQNAKDAGAAGILIGTVQNGWLPPLYPWECGCAQYQPVDIPFVGLADADAKLLDKLLAAGTVKITVTDSGISPYLYDLEQACEGTIPSAPLNLTVKDADLAEIPTTYHGDRQDLIDLETSSFLPDEYFKPGTAYDFVPAGTTIDRFYGPPSADRVWVRHDYSAGGNVPLAGWFTSVLAIGKHPEQWHEAPEAVPGPYTPASDVFAAQPDSNWGADAPTLGGICSFCRAGDDFYPATDIAAGANPGLAEGRLTYQPDSMHMYGPDGTEIPLSTAGLWPAYVLPDASSRYRFTTSGGGVDSAWTFTSKRPVRDDAPIGYVCLSKWPVKGTDPCHADPLIFLRYNGFAAADNSVTASAWHQLDITPVYQQDPGGTATLSSITVWTSTDGGTTWTKAATHRDPDGSYTAKYHVPATTGSVAVKVQASDPRGDTVAQTLHNAFTISG